MSANTSAVSPRSSDEDAHTVPRQVYEQLQKALNEAKDDKRKAELRSWKLLEKYNKLRNETDPIRCEFVHCRRE